MTPVEAKYVVIGISLGNEGVHENGARAVLSYRENMPRLIRMLQEQGRVVIVTNNYPRADFNEVDYEDLCEVNLEVQQWNVPTINVFGTINDGAGRWAEHMWNGSDIYHPNQVGHEAMASAFPLTMWEALRAGKPLPEYIPTQGDDNGVECLSFVPEGQVQSYTLSYISADTTYTEVYSAAQRKLWQYANGQQVSVTEGIDKTIGTIDDGAGRWAEHMWNGSDIYHPNQVGHEAMASAFPLTMWEALQAGKPLPKYIPTQGDENGVECVSFVPEGQVQSYTLSYTSADTIYTEVYSAAQQKFWQYANGQLVAASEGIDKAVGTITIQGSNIHQLLFYRAAMTEREVRALARGKILRSSLEIYCPLLGGDATNYAQTMNCVTIHNK
jgi:uncharacterized OB-fold protein